MTYLQKNLVLIGALFLLLLVVWVAFVVVRYKNAELSVDEQTGDLINTDSEDNSGDVGVSSDLIDTSDWQTFRSEKFGFEIKYPPELIGSEITYEGLSNAGYWRSYIHFNLESDKLVNHAVLALLNPEQVEVELWRADELEVRRRLSSELDEIGST